MWLGGRNGSSVGGGNMLQPFQPEMIYDAVTDDGAFDALSGVLAQAIGARSGVCHWNDFRDSSEDISYSGYFSGDHMAEYERHFSDADLWSTAINRPDRVNKVWNLEALVPSPEYESSRLYNEWIRPMGDDSFHAIGAALRSDAAVGEIAFHRGKSQGAFSEDALKIVENGLGHIRRMMELRSKLGACRRLSAGTSAALDLIGHGVIMLHRSGRLLHSNLAAEAILRRGDGLMLSGGHLKAYRASDQAVLQTAIDRASAPSGMEGGAVRVHRATGRPYDISILSTHIGSERQLILVLTDPDAANCGRSARLRDLYDLTGAEAEVAMRVAEGLSPQQIAAERGVSAATVHSQLKAIFSKLGCGRQAELAAVVSMLPRIYRSDGPASKA